ncbi:hypothetical protein LWM68_38275 [Niabella sp. W65]|nr:hypothetical protein [Niabella sp. W65]MCH7368074.1 hypothetical protein [Niabella sp. W65]ULT43698.1 hypothetical protein KRR40_09940 [Niabella sp. I65]
MFGKIGAGYGTDDRYTGDGVMQFYNKRTQAGIAAGINNINKEEGTGENAFLENTFKSNFRVFLEVAAAEPMVLPGELMPTPKYNTAFLNRITLNSITACRQTTAT